MDPYYVGDPMPGDNVQWISPPGGPINGYGCITSLAGISFDNSQQWRRKVDGTSITLCLDVPGVRIEDANVEIDSDIIKFNGKRHDTGMMVSSTYNVGHDYDPESAIAVIDVGVLTIKIERFTSRRSHKVRIIAP